MSEGVVTLANSRVVRAAVTVPNVGPWFADVTLEDEGTSVTGRVTLSIGDLQLVGTVDPKNTGVFREQKRVRLVAGAGSWATQLGAKAYHNDAGVNPLSVATDAAREAGETLGTFEPTTRLGNDYVRNAGLASTALERAALGSPWWVDYNGVTHVASRPDTATSAVYEVLNFDPNTRRAEISVDDPNTLSVGDLIETGNEALAIRELEIIVEPESLRLWCWLGGAESERSQAAELLTAIAKRAVDAQLFGLYRYRVFSMQGSRVKLQAVSKAAGLPDLIPVEMRPGVAGAHANLANSSEVLVQFIEGDRAQPVVTAFAGRDNPGHVPTRLNIGGNSDSECADVARKGDTVDVPLPPMVFVGTIGGSPASGVVSATLPKAIGAITTGSSKAGIAT